MIRLLLMNTHTMDFVFSGIRNRRIQAHSYKLLLQKISRAWTIFTGSSRLFYILGRRKNLYILSKGIAAN